MSKTIKVLGTGCPKCKKVIALVEEVVKENKIDATLIKVEDIMEIMEYDVISTPAIVVDEQIKIKGRVPSKKEILDLLTKEDMKIVGINDCGCSQDNCC